MLVQTPTSSQVIQVLPSHGPMRLDKFISVALPDFSRTYFKYLIEKSLISINGTIASKASITVKPHDIITVSFPQQEFQPAIIGAFDVGVSLVFEHEHFFIMNKPAGLVMHPALHDYQQAPTMLDWLLSKFPALKAIGPSERPALVHRLDKETSGLVIVPRSNYAHQIFSKLFQARKIQKTYLAVVHGHPEKQGTISHAIGRCPVNRKKMRAFKEPEHYIRSVSDLQKQLTSHKTRSAITHYKTLENFDEFSLIEAKPITGRTHQIRVHLHAQGFPLVGDILYHHQSPLISRHALHASTISFEFDNVSYEFAAELPDDFQKMLAILRTQKS